MMGIYWHIEEEKSFLRGGPDSLSRERDMSKCRGYSGGNSRGWNNVNISSHYSCTSAKLDVSHRPR